MHAFILTAGHVLFVWAIHFSLWTSSRNLKKTKITPISVNGSRDVSFPETYNPMVCEICNGTEAELYILYVKGIFSVWLNFIIACMQSYTKLLYIILTFLSLYIYRGRNCGMYSLKLELVIEDFTLKNNKSRKG